MYTSGKEGRWLTQVAIFVLVIFCGVILLHPFIPHDHPHESQGNSMFTTVHTTDAEKFLSFFIALLFAFSLPFLTSKQEDEHSFERRAGKSPPYIRPPLFNAFAQGILNTKRY